MRWLLAALAAAMLLAPAPGEAQMRRGPDFLPNSAGRGPGRPDSSDSTTI